MSDLLSAIFVVAWLLFVAGVVVVGLFWALSPLTSRSKESARLSDIELRMDCLEAERFELSSRHSTAELDRLRREFERRAQDWNRIAALAEAVGFRWEPCGEADGKWVKGGGVCVDLRKVHGWAWNAPASNKEGECADASARFADTKCASFGDVLTVLHTSSPTTAAHGAGGFSQYAATASLGPSAKSPKRKRARGSSTGAGRSGKK